jgi:hypothetical protein
MCLSPVILVDLKEFHGGFIVKEAMRKDTDKEFMDGFRIALHED